MSVPQTATVADLIKLVLHHPDFSEIERPSVRAKGVAWPLHMADCANPQIAAIVESAKGRPMVDLGIKNGDELFVDLNDAAKSSKSILLLFS